MITQDQAIEIAHEILAEQRELKCSPELERDMPEDYPGGHDWFCCQLQKAAMKGTQP